MHKIGNENIRVILNAECFISLRNALMVKISMVEIKGMQLNLRKSDMSFIDCIAVLIVLN